MDEIDLAILGQLQSDSRLSLAELGRRVGLTSAPVQRRLRSLERDGWVSRYVALLSPGHVHRTFEVYLEVELVTESRPVLDAFEERVTQLPEVLECHRISGDVHYLLKGMFRDAKAFDEFYTGVLLAWPDVRRTTRHVSLARVKYTTALPLPRAPRDL